jgi:hypothetical protein
MLVYNKQDKNGSPIIVTIKEELIFDTPIVTCTIKKTVIKKKWYGTKEKLIVLFEKSVSLYVVNQWTCKDFENWADAYIVEYNKELTNKEYNEKILNLIKNGCK